MEISKLILQSGENYYLYSSHGKEYSIRNPKLKDIIALEKKEIGLYYKYLYTLVSTSLDVADILLYEAGIWYEDIKDEWKFFLQKSMTNESKKIKVIIRDKSDMGISEFVVNGAPVDDLYRDALNFFFNTQGEYIIWASKGTDTNGTYLINVKKKEKVNKNEEDVYIFDEANFKLNPHIYNVMLEVLKKENWIKPEYEFLKGGTNYAKKYILKHNYKDRSKNHKSTIDLSSIVSALTAKGQKYEDILNYSIYLIYDLYYRFVKIDEWNNTMTALNSGCIDTKKNPINYEKIHWGSIID